MNPQAKQFETHERRQGQIREEEKKLELVGVRYDQQVRYPKIKERERHGSKLKQE